MSILGNRIKIQREKLNLTREDLAKKIGVSYSAIAMYEQGNREPNNEIALKMCNIFDCSMDYLTGNSEFTTKKEEARQMLRNELSAKITSTIENNLTTFSLIGLNSNQIKDFIDILSELVCSTEKENVNKKLKCFFEQFPKKERILLSQVTQNLMHELKSEYTNELIKTKDDLHKIEREKFYMCPVYGQISAGQPNWAEECIEGRIPIDPELMNIINPEEYFFLRVNGESMNKVIKNGAFALIHKQDIVDDGEVAVVLVNGYDATLKKFTKQGDIVILEPQSNDDSFNTQVYDKNTTIKILGKYVGKMEINK